MYLLSNRIQPVSGRQGGGGTVYHHLKSIQAVLAWGLQYDKIKYEDIKVRKIAKIPAEGVQQTFPAGTTGINRGYQIPAGYGTADSGGGEFKTRGY